MDEGGVAQGRGEERKSVLLREVEAVREGQGTGRADSFQTGRGPSPVSQCLRGLRRVKGAIGHQDLLSGRERGHEELSVARGGDVLNGMRGG